MANNYQPTINSGADSSWIRAAQIIINSVFNPATPTTPTVTVSVVEEQDFVLASGSTFAQPLPPGISFQEVSMSSTFNLLDASGNVTGTATDAQLYQMLHSKYVSLAQARDAAAANQTTPSGSPAGTIE